MGAAHRREALTARLGETETVLFETADSGLTDTYLPVRATGGIDLTNQIHGLTIVSLEDSALVGELLG